MSVRRVWRLRWAFEALFLVAVVVTTWPDPAWVAPAMFLLGALVVSVAWSVEWRARRPSA